MSEIQPFEYRKSMGRNCDFLYEPFWQVRFYKKWTLPPGQNFGYPMPGITLTNIQFYEHAQYSTECNILKNLATYEGTLCLVVFSQFLDFQMGSPCKLQCLESQWLKSGAQLLHTYSLLISDVYFIRILHLALIYISRKVGCPKENNYFSKLMGRFMSIE